jgi:cold shock CspA family protein
LSDVKEPLGEGDLVEFSVLDFKGRPKAQDVVKISGPPPPVIDRVRGTCLWYDATRKMGFLKGSDGQEIFCHASDVKDRIGEGLCGNQRVRGVHPTILH